MELLSFQPPLLHRLASPSAGFTGVHTPQSQILKGQNLGLWRRDHAATPAAMLDT